MNIRNAMAHPKFNTPQQLTAANKQLQSDFPDPVIFSKIDNYMEQSFNNKNFNCYETGPGAALANQRGSQRYQICIKQVPQIFSETTLSRILKNFGALTDLHKSKKPSCTYYFANCATEKDFEAILKGMERNEFGIKVEPKTELKKSASSQFSYNPQHNSSVTSNLNNNNNNYSYTRPQQNLNKKPHPELGKLRNKSDDENESEHGFNHRSSKQNGLKNNTIRNESVIKMKCKESEGTYNPEKDCYVKTCSEMPEVQLGHCYVCKKSSTQICIRCNEFYCSVECQTKDWPTHKQYCYKMPSLYDTNVTANKTIETTAAANTFENNITTNHVNTTHNSNYPKKQQAVKNTVDEYKPQANTSSKENMPKEDMPKEDHHGRDDNRQNYNRNRRGRNSINSNHSDKENRKSDILNRSVGSVKSNSENQKPKILKSGQLVIITFVDQTNMVFVRSHEKEDRENYFKILYQVEKSANKSKVLTVMPKIGEYVLSHDGTAWFRAIVKNIESKDHIFITYVDFGNCEYKKLSDLRELLPELNNLMCYPMPIYLKNLDNRLQNEKFTDYINDLVNSFTELKIVYKPEDMKNGKIIAELINEETNENINNKCVELLKAEAPGNGEEPFLFEDLAKENLPSGKNISVFILDELLLDAGIITCIPVEAINELEQLNKELKEYAGKINEIYTPRENELCIAKYSDNPEVWYRAVCYEVTGNGLPVLFFIDYGNTSPVSITNIRKYPKSFTLPCKTNECQIAGLEHLLKKNASKQLQAKLRELLPLYTEIVVPKVENIDGENDLLYLPDVIQKVSDAGLI